ncbi:hypothetical protein [Xanthomonas translucens]|uniref:hypothetical protein n=1 Tax=Xanthomonas campestris pv. translucens TaxID=343 RepID=UPI000A8C2367|nr:hypothetical protein [Xanthomonas translucens]
MNNSASKLLAILENCRKQPNGRSCTETWKDVLSVDSNTKLIGAFGEFFSLAESASKEILAIHKDDSGVEYWKARIFNGFHSTALARPWAEFVQHIDDITIFTLKAHAALLDMKTPSRDANAEEFEKIDKLLKEATSFLMELELSNEAKEVILSRIEQLQALIRRYRFVSPAAVLDSAKILAAELSVAAKEQPDTVRNSKFYSTVKEGLELLANATQVASAKPMLIGATTYLLGLIS